MSEVFISYARETEAYAKKVAEALRGAGFGVWYDEDLPAHRAFSEVIEERLREAKAVIVIWSAEAVKSEWVRAEADFARQARTLIQARVDGTNQPLPFNQIQCVDLSGWSGNSDAPAWRKIVSSVRELAGRTKSQDENTQARSARGQVPERTQINEAASSTMQRKLTAVLWADVVGHFIRLDVDEIGTLERLKAHRLAIFDPCVAAHGGRVFKLLTDTALV